MLTLTVLSRSAGTPRVPILWDHPCQQPREGTGDSATHSTAQPAQSKAQSFAGDFKWLLVKENSQRWEKGVTRMLTRMGKG